MIPQKLRKCWIAAANSSPILTRALMPLLGTVNNNILTFSVEKVQIPSPCHIQMCVWSPRDKKAPDFARKTAWNELGACIKVPNKCTTCSKDGLLRVPYVAPWSCFSNLPCRMYASAWSPFATPSEISSKPPPRPAPQLSTVILPWVSCDSLKNGRHL